MGDPGRVVTQHRGGQRGENGSVERNADSGYVLIARYSGLAGPEAVWNGNEFVQKLQGGGFGGNGDIAAAKTRPRLVFQFHGAGGC